MSGRGGVLSPIKGAAEIVSVAAGDSTVKLAAASGFKPPAPEQTPSFSISSSASASASHRSVAVPGSSSAASSQVETKAAKVNGRNRLSLRSVFEVVPSAEEAEAAIAVLKQTFSPSASYDISENIHSFFGMEAADRGSSSYERKQKAVSTGKDLLMHAPSQQQHHRPFNNLKELSQVQKSILNLASLLHLNPGLQRMVLSLSSDKAVWDAVMKNETVQELKKSFLAASGITEHSALDEGNGSGPTASACRADEGNSDIAKWILSWILDNIKTTLSGLIDKITLLVNDVFLSSGQEKTETIDILDEIKKSSLKLSLMVFIVVVVTRIKQI